MRRDQGGGPTPSRSYLRDLASEEQEAVMHEGEKRELIRRRLRDRALDDLADAAEWNNAPREERWGP